MKNFVQPGRIVTAIAAADVASGDGVLIGSLFGVATTDAATGEEFEVATDGVFDLPKTTGQAWAAAWAAVFWDNTAKKLTNVASGNTKIGVNVRAESSAAAIGRVRLNGIF